MGNLQLTKFKYLTLRLTMEKYRTIKEQLLQHCLSEVEERITTNSQILERLQDSLTQETKSSAGDKFETSRAMLQIDIDRHQGLMIKAKAMRQKLSVLSIEPSEVVREGSLVITDKNNFFISVAIGKVILSDTYYVISLASPIGQKMKNGRAGDTITFNNLTKRIVAVY